MQTESPPDYAAVSLEQIGTESRGGEQLKPADVVRLGLHSRGAVAGSLHAAP